MKMPWVSRDQADRARFDAQAWRDAFDREFAAHYETIKRLDALLTKYHELAVPKTPATTNGNGHTPHTERRLSVVTQAIRDEAKGDTRLAAHFAKLASDLKREGKKDEEIEQSIRGWQSTEDEGL